MRKVILSVFCLSLYAGMVQAQDNKAAPGLSPVPAKPAAGLQQPAATPVPASAGAAVPVVDENAGKFKFKEETHDYGEVPEGPLAETDFEFKNVGKKPIIIQEAHGSCGCTVPTWPHEPILPGQKAVIHVAYSTNGRPGPIMKDITINSNAQQSPMVLHIKGTVKPKPTGPTLTPTPSVGKL